MIQEENNKYCTGCGQKLPEANIGNLLLNIIVKQPKVHFIDGNPYCETCARIIVEKKRRILK